MNTDDIYEKYLMSERGRLYLSHKVEDLEKEIFELQKKIHELAHQVEQSQKNGEYWQSIYARQF